MKFVFALAQVLKAREAEEQREEAALASLLLDRVKLEEEENLLEKKLKGDSKAERKSTSVTEYKRIHSEKMIIIRSLRDIHDQKGRLSQKITTQRMKMIQASKAKKILEKLKESKHKEFMSEMDREEQKLMNEWGYLSYNRQS